MSNANWVEVLEPLLLNAGLRAPIEAIVPLAGGVSSDIVRVDLADGTMVCAKRALPRLKVASLWEAPLERNHYEVAWLRLASSIVPGIAPKVLGEDQASGVAVMEFLAPADYLLWKSELLAGNFDAQVPIAVATSLAKIHATTWGDPRVAQDFATDQMFDALRLSPYLRTLVERTPDLASSIRAVLETTARHRLALIHGDVSPKNILVSRRTGQPVLLDAECAWFGDPTFDAAFCMNHLLLKAVHVPAIRRELLESTRKFFQTWQAGLPSDARTAVEQRLVRLLPCLLLARIDGKSPVEYLGEGQRNLVRTVSRRLIAQPPGSVEALVNEFQSLTHRDLQ